MITRRHKDPQGAAFTLKSVKTSLGSSSSRSFTKIEGSYRLIHTASVSENDAATWLYSQVCTSANFAYAFCFFWVNVWYLSSNIHMIILPGLERRQSCISPICFHTVNLSGEQHTHQFWSQVLWLHKEYHMHANCTNIISSLIATYFTKNTLPHRSSFICSYE